MKGKSKRIQMRHEVSDHGKIDRVVQKSFRDEASHKLETSTWSNGFMTYVKKMLAKLTGFFKKKQPLHTGVSTKSYCQKFGGAFGGASKPKDKSKYIRRYGYVGAKMEKRLNKSIIRNGGVVKLNKEK